MRFRRPPPPEEPRGSSPATALPPATWRGLPFPSSPVSLPARTAPTPGEVVPTSEDEQRADDQALLRALVAHLGSMVEAFDVAVDPASDPEDEREVADDETDERARAEKELDVFAGMLGTLAWGPRVLSPKQRAWAVQAAERLDVSWGDPGARNRAVPRGAEVALLVDSTPRPLDPPGRKVGGRTFSEWAREAGYPHTGDVAKARELWRAGVPPRLDVRADPACASCGEPLPPPFACCEACGHPRSAS